MHIVFITNNYPSLIHPTKGTFVQQFVRAMARQGNDCSVISPVSIFDRRFGKYPSRFSTEDVDGNNLIKIYSPFFISCSSLSLGMIHTGRWTNFFFTQKILLTIAKLHSYPDIIYGHFLYPSGYAAISAANKMRVPSVVGVGEGEFWTVEAEGFMRAKLHMQKASAFLAVSNCISEALISSLMIPEKKIDVFPNGVDLGVFHPLSRSLMCTELGISSDNFNIGYVGSFTTNKGYPHLREAVEGLENVKLVLLGSGTLSPSDSMIAFSGVVSHSRVTAYLATCQIFVLPTLVEGSCNSVIEAMACGLPIVTGNGRYMDDIVDDNVAIRVDPTDVSAIREAILTLKNDSKLRMRMAEACLNKSKNFNINERAKRVTSWMTGIVNSQKNGSLS